MQRSLLTILLGSGLSAVSLCAQGVQPFPLVCGAPFQADSAITITDSKGVNHAVGRVARNSVGSIYQEVVRANTGKVIEVLIYDIPGKRLIKLESQKKMYVIEEVPDLKANAVDPASLARQMKEAEDRKLAQTGEPIDPTTPQSLGTRNIEGILTVGYRTTITGHIDGKAVPAVRERWYSPELQIDLLSRTVSDEQQTETVLTRIQRGEPDESLFLIPADYFQYPMNRKGGGQPSP
jgi:hypothetical protein